MELVDEDRNERDTSNKFSIMEIDAGHQQINTIKKPHKCPTCPARFGYPSQLSIHLSVHKEDRPFGCSECDMTFKTKGVLWGHMKVHTTSKSFDCSLCHKKFRSKGGFEAHLRIHTSKPFISGISEHQSFSKQQKGQEHKCQICSKLCKTPTHLKLHMVVHIREKTFNCSQCPKTFKRKNALRDHLVNHNGGNFKCTFCPKEFSVQGRLTEHLRLHTKEKPYKCKLCPYRSRFTVGKHHMKNHDIKEHFKCRFCSFSSRRSDRILQHEQNVHGYSIVCFESNSYIELKAQTNPSLKSQPFTCNLCEFTSFNEKCICIHYKHCHEQPIQSTDEVTSLGQGMTRIRSTKSSTQMMTASECMDGSWEDILALDLTITKTSQISALDLTITKKLSYSALDLTIAEKL